MAPPFPGPPLPGWLPLAGGRIHAAPGFRDRALGLGWDRLETVGALDRGERVRSTPMRVTLRERDGEEILFRKVHLLGWAGAGWRDRLRRLLTPPLSPARTELLLGRRVAELGILVPEPLLLAEDGRRGGISILVTRGVVGPDPETAGPGLLEAAALLVATLHGAGLVHRDLYRDHLLPGPHRGELWLADLQRVMRPRFAFERWRVKDLAALLHSRPAWAGALAPRRFLVAYGRCLGLDHRDLRRLARRVESKERRMAAHTPRWDRLRRPGHSPAPGA